MPDPAQKPSGKLKKGLVRCDDAVPSVVPREPPEQAAMMGTKTRTFVLLPPVSLDPGRPRPPGSLLPAPRAGARPGLRVRPRARRLRRTGRPGWCCRRPRRRSRAHLTRRVAPRRYHWVPTQRPHPATVVPFSTAWEIGRPDPRTISLQFSMGLAAKTKTAGGRRGACLQPGHKLLWSQSA
jgi:hypothetical protein